MTSAENTNAAIDRLAVLKFFPRDLRVRQTLVRVVRDMAVSDAQVEWLVGRMLVLYNEWPGPRELRALYCSKFAPRDGIEARSLDYPDGYPSEAPRSSPRTGALVIREKHDPRQSIDEDFDSAVLRLAAEKAMTRRREKK